MDNIAEATTQEQRKMSHAFGEKGFLKRPIKPLKKARHGSHKRSSNLVSHI
jgi:hypothetical protein